MIPNILQNFYILLEFNASNCIQVLDFKHILQTNRIVLNFQERSTSFLEVRHMNKYVQNSAEKLHKHSLYFYISAGFQSLWLNISMHEIKTLVKKKSLLLLLCYSILLHCVGNGCSIKCLLSLRTLVEAA